MTWPEAIEDRNLNDLPFKVELNRDGNLVLTQRRVSQGGYQAQISVVLTRQLPGGVVVIDDGIETSDNVKVADVAWFASGHWQHAKYEAACNTAPAICVEVTSKDDFQREFDEKKALYFEAGVQEVWLCGRFGNMSFFTPAGQAQTSPMCPGFPAAV